MNVDTKKIQRIVKGLLAAMPVTVPYLMKRKRTSLLPFVLGGIGFAIAGGAIATMLLSPRTRKRALLVAKDTYGKMNEKVGHLREHLPNGIADSKNHAAVAKEYPTSGL